MRSRWDSKIALERMAISHIGMRLDGEAVKAEFGYSPSTYLPDTKIYKYGWLQYINRTSPAIYEIVRGKSFEFDVTSPLSKGQER